VLVVGAGGLGSPAAFYLAAAGVGTLRIVDDDHVELSNLQRQILHTQARIGQPKVASAEHALGALNPQVRIEAIAERVTTGNARRLLEGVDVVIDGADNFATRYVLNDACVGLGKPLVYGAVLQFEGQVSVFDAGRRRGQAPCYRCLFPAPPPPELAPNCADAGVLGVLPGVIGCCRPPRRSSCCWASASRWPGGCSTSMRWRCISTRCGSTPIRRARCAPRPAADEAGDGRGCGGAMRAQAQAGKPAAAFARLTLTARRHIEHSQRSQG